MILLSHGKCQTVSLLITILDALVQLDKEMDVNKANILIKAILQDII